VWKDPEIQGEFLQNTCQIQAGGMIVPKIVMGCLPTLLISAIPQAPAIASNTLHYCSDSEQKGINNH
jgi:hypothetical protein